jgi:hypothetical protein
MTAPNRPRWAAAGCTALFALAAGACAPAPRATPAAPPAVTAFPTVTSVSTLHLPIERYLLPPLQAVQADWIRSVQVSSCMRRFGFSYPAGIRPTAGSQAVNAYTVMFRRYGVTEAPSVRVWGYHVPRPFVGAAPRPATPEKRVASQDEETVLTGQDPSTGKPAVRYGGRAVPAGGCLDEPVSAAGSGFGGLSEPDPEADRITAALKDESFTASTADPRVKAAFARWSACMAQHGYRFADPLTAAGVPSMAAPGPTPAEIAQAEDDVACKAKTRLVGIWFAVESAYQAAEIRANAAKFEAIRKARDAKSAEIRHLFRRYAA